MITVGDLSACFPLSWYCCKHGCLSQEVSAYPEHLYPVYLKHTVESHRCVVMLLSLQPPTIHPIQSEWHTD